MEDNAIRTAAEIWEVGIADNVSGEERSGQARWRICTTTGMDTEAEEMWYSNR